VKAVAAPAGWLFKGVEFGGADADLLRPEGLTLTPAGRVAMVCGDAAIRQSIMLLLSTIPGERVMRPDYGCPLHRLMFAPNDATTAGLAIHYVRQALTWFEPRIDIVCLDAVAAGLAVRDSGRESAAAQPADEPYDPAMLVVSLTYKVKATNRVAELKFSVGLDGEGVK
jgi:uncharacterized protein